MDFRETLSSAVNKLLNHEESLAASLFNRAIELGAPRCLVDLKAMTMNYMVLPLSINLCDFSKYGYYISAGAENYFKNLINLRNIAQNDSLFQNDYVEALKSLINIKELFFRAAGIDYHTEILKSTTGTFVEEIFTLYNIIQQIYDDVISKDALRIRYYVPNFNMRDLAFDLLEVKAFCLNLLLSYTSVEHTSFQSHGYTATTVIDAPFAETTVRENTSMHTDASICPRLHLIRGQKARYTEYKAIYDKTVADINRDRNFKCPTELRNGIGNMVMHKVTPKTGKNYFRFIKPYEKRVRQFDSSFSFLDIFALGLLLYMALFSFISPIKINTVCSFELDVIFTRKFLLGVCNMIANGKHLKISVVRYFFVLFAPLGVVVYLVLALAMKSERYPTVFVEKHC